MDIRVRDLDGDVVAQLKAQAKRRGRTLNSELQDLLTEAAWRPRRLLAEQLSEAHAQFRALHGELPDSTALIREERDRWS